MTFLKTTGLKAAAIATVAAIGFTALPQTAAADSVGIGERGVTLQLAHGGHGGYNYKTECVAKAFRRNGKKLRGTRGHAVRKIQRRACRVALRECRERLNYKRRVSARGFPHARCKVTRVDRIAVNHHRHHNHGYKKWGGIVLKF